MIRGDGVISNCTWCQNSISSDRLSSLFSTTYSFPCNHKIHKSCLTNWSDQIYRTDPTQSTLSCPECRAVTPIPTKHSAEQILQWIKIAQGVIVSAGTILGGGVGAGVSVIVKNYSPLTLETVQKVTRLSPKISFSLAVGALAFLGSHSLSHSRQFHSWISNIITSLFNWIHETNIQPLDVLIYESGIISRSPQEQCKIFIQYLMDVQLLHVSLTLKAVPFNDEEKFHVQPLLLQLESLETNHQEMDELFINYLIAKCLDLYAKINNLGAHLLEKTGNEELKEDLDYSGRVWLVYHLKSTDPVVVEDSTMAARVALVSVLEVYKEKIKFDRDFRQQWIALLSFLQEECRSLTSTLLADLQGKMGEGFFARPLIELLWDEEIVDDIFAALYKIREKAFTEKVFFISFKRE